MPRKIAIVDYGLGNIFSAHQSFKKTINENDINADVFVSCMPKEVINATHVVLPGQGAFQSCMNGLNKINGMIETLNEFALNQKKPFLGICVGMQLLATDSEENGKHKGLNWISGNIKKLPDKKLKMPHMGWNEVLPQNANNNKLITENKDYYFIHSYYFQCQNRDNIMAYSKYGIDFPSIVFKENIYGVQFHPEKSSLQGLELIKRFIEL